MSAALGVAATSEAWRPKAGDLVRIRHSTDSNRARRRGEVIEDDGSSDLPIRIRFSDWDEAWFDLYEIEPPATTPAPAYFWLGAGADAP